MAQRLAWEQVEIARSILHYANLGLHKGVAFLIGHAFDTNGNETSNNWHVGVDSSLLDANYIKNFVTGNAKSDPLFSEQLYYTENVHSTWGDRDGKLIKREIAEYAANLPPPALLPNPFAKSFNLVVSNQDDKTIVAYFDEHLRAIVDGVVEEDVAEPVVAPAPAAIFVGDEDDDVW